MRGSLWKNIPESQNLGIFVKNRGFSAPFDDLAENTTSRQGVHPVRAGWSHFIPACRKEQ
jgi:hypothetical protein